MKSIIFLLNLIALITFISVFPPNSDTFATVFAWSIFCGVLFFTDILLYGSYVGIRHLWNRKNSI
ncbi:MAG: hypothetical protein ACD_5C00202G0001 [uncultured bacterium]|nr:MAG: hypothetical protein ACD_5C00202G0001 [uncultured bacterium]